MNNISKIIKLIIIFILLIFTINTYSQIDTSKTKITTRYGTKGWELQYGNYNLMRIQWRLQFRSVITSEDSIQIREEDNVNGTFNVQRARIKVGGFAYRPYIKYYLEYDFPSGYLLNWEFTFAKFKTVQFKLGQWKIKYNTERFISSGKQQFADRSISNRYFTYDRQIGVELLGTILDNSPFSSSYNLGVFNGDGRMAEDEDGHLMFFGRYQWNFTGKEAKMSFCDIKQTKNPIGFISASYVYNQSAYTRFSSDGGGSITGFELGTGDQYIINQLGIELFFKYKGFSLMSENHIKKIDDTVNKEKSELTGGYAMAGYFPNAVFDFFPKNLELIFRYALVNNSKFVQNSIEEYSFGLNWFFKSHLNKLTFDVSFLDNENFDAKEDNLRIRLQWDVSF